MAFPQLRLEKISSSVQEKNTFFCLNSFTPSKQISHASYVYYWLQNRRCTNYVLTVLRHFLFSGSSPGRFLLSDLPSRPLPKALKRNTSDPSAPPHMPMMTRLDSELSTELASCMRKHLGFYFQPAQSVVNKCIL